MLQDKTIKRLFLQLYHFKSFSHEEVDMLHTLQVVGTFLFIAILLELFLIQKKLDQDPEE